MTDDREPKTESPINDCLCDWVLKDTGTMFRPHRVKRHRRCPVHRRNFT